MKSIPSSVFASVFFEKDDGNPGRNGAISIEIHSVRVPLNACLVDSIFLAEFICLLTDS